MDPISLGIMGASALAPVVGQWIGADSNASATAANNATQIQLAQMGEQYNTASVNAQEKFQADMSNSAVTRHMQDMAMAGLNPTLAAGGQASSPSGGSASAIVPHTDPVSSSAGMAAGLTAAGSSAMQLMSGINALRTTDADVALKEQQKDAVSAGAAKDRASAAAILAGMPSIKGQADAAQSLSDASKAEAAVRQGRASWDQKMMGYDQVFKRLMPVVNGVSSALGGKFLLDRISGALKGSGGSDVRGSGAHNIGSQDSGLMTGGEVGDGF